MLGFDAWLQKQGYPSFCKVVMENGLAKLEIIVDAVTGLPRVFAVEAWIEFCIGMMTGDVEKGGCSCRASSSTRRHCAFGSSKEELRRWPGVNVANPMYDGWTAAVMKYVQSELPVARVEKRLPPALTTGVFNEMIKHIDLTSATRDVSGAVPTGCFRHKFPSF